MNRIERGVAEADQLVGAGALHARQPLTQRRLPQRQGLAVLEVVIRLLRPAERSVENGLGAAQNRREGDEQGDEDAGACPHGVSGSSA